MNIPETPQDLLKQLNKEVDKLWEDLVDAQRNFERASKEVIHNKSIIDSVTKQIDEKEQYIQRVSTWHKK